MTPAGFLTIRNGAPCVPVPFETALLNHAHLDKVLCLYEAAMATAPKELLAREEDGFFEAHLDQRGRTLGIFAQEELIGYTVLGLPRPGDPNFGAFLDLPPDDYPHIAHIDGTVIQPQWRGNAIHVLLIKWRLDLARQSGRSIALATVAPGNTVSAHNLLVAGMTIRALRRKFDGWRYIVRYDLDVADQVPKKTDDTRWIDIDDIDTQRNLLEKGFVGTSIENHKVSYVLP